MKVGTIRTRGHWEIFDQFICSSNLLNRNGLQISQKETVVCTEDLLMEEDKGIWAKNPSVPILDRFITGELVIIFPSPR